MTSYKWAVSFPDSLCVRVVLLLILYIVCESDALGIPQISDVARLRPNIFYTIARQHDSLEFLCDGRRKTVLWILPNNQIVNVNQTSNHNETIEFQESTLIISKHTLKIPAIRVGMNGQYTCLREDGEQFHFYVLQVSPKINFFNAIIMSITIAVGFALVCLTVLFLDKYCSRPGSAVRPASMRFENPDHAPMISRQWL